MGIKTGTVTGQVIESNRGSANVRLLQVQLLGSVPETVEFFNVSGEDTAPAEGDKVIVFELSDGFKFTMGTKDLIEASVLAGEKKIYSQDGGAVKAFITWFKTGVLRLNGDGDHAVRYAQLQTAFDELKTAFNNHDHVYTPGTGTPTTTASAVPQSAADITTSKIDTIEVPA
jgi:hypothetical protein